MRRARAGGGVPFVLISTVVVGCAVACSGGDALSADPHVDDLPSLTLVEELRLGDREDPDVGFSRVGAAVPTPDGGVVVLEQEARELRIFDIQGTLVRTMGGWGEGPGEFDRPTSMGLVGDTVWVRDPGNSRFTLFTLSGDLLTTVPILEVELDQPVPGVVVMGVPSRLRSDGRFEGRVNVRNLAGPAEGLSGSAPILLFDESGAVVDTAGEREWSVDPGMTIGGQAVPPLPPPFPESAIRLEVSEETTVRVHRRAATAASESTFSVVGLNPHGDTLFTSRFRYDPAPVPQSTSDTILDTRAQALAPVLQESPDAVRRELESALSLPHFFPSVSDARIGSDGTIWLRREDDGIQASRWILLEEDGAPRGALELPVGSSVHWSDRSHLWVVELDAFDVPWLVRYEMEASEGSR